MEPMKAESAKTLPEYKLVIKRVDELKPHPQNDYYFDDIDGPRWDEFVESVGKVGVLVPPIITQDDVIVAGRQRQRACQATGVEYISCLQRSYTNETDVIRDLIETNIKQRGVINLSGQKTRRIIATLEDIYGVSRGRSRKGAPDAEGMTQRKTQKEIARDVLGIDINQYRRIKRLMDAIPEFQELSDGGLIPVTVVANLISRLTPEEQRELLIVLPSGVALTESDIQSYIEKIRGLEKENGELTAEMVAQQRVIQSNGKTDYLTLQKKLTDTQEQYRKEYERSEQLKKNLDRAEQEASKNAVLLEQQYDAALSSLSEKDARIEELEELILHESVSADESIGTLSNTLDVEVQAEPETLLCALEGIPNRLFPYVWQTFPSEQLRSYLGRIEEVIRSLQTVRNELAKAMGEG